MPTPTLWKVEDILWDEFYVVLVDLQKISVLAIFSVWQCSTWGISQSITEYEADGWQHVHYRNHLKQSVWCLIFVLRWWLINPFKFSNIMSLDSVVLSPQVLNKYSILVDVKSGRFKYQSRWRVGDKAKKHKSPAKRRRVGINACLKQKLI